MITSIVTKFGKTTEAINPQVLKLVYEAATLQNRLDVLLYQVDTKSELHWRLTKARAKAELRVYRRSKLNSVTKFGMPT